MLKKKLISLLLVLTMATTSPQIILTLGDADLASVSSSDEHAISTLNDLVTGDDRRSLNYATFEPSGWLLDGNAGVYDHPQNIGFVSDVISNGSGVLVSPPEIRLTLTSAVDIEQGITLEFFMSDYADDVDIDYKDASDTLIASESHTPDGYNYFCAVGATRAAVKYIDLTFNGTSANYRHVRLVGVYVDGVMWDKENIRTANIIEEISPVSVESPSGELGFSLYSADGDFSIVNPQGVYEMLERGQVVDTYETVNGARLYMGRFYLNKWWSKSENIAEFECVDALARLGEEIVLGDIHEGSTVSDFMTWIFSDSNDYSVDASIASRSVYGWQPTSTKRDALKQMAISVGAYVTCSRSGVVLIKEMELIDSISAYDFALDDSDTAGKVVERAKVVTGIDITAHLYVPGDLYADEEIYRAVVVAGEYTIEIPNRILQAAYLYSDPGIDSLTATLQDSPPPTSGANWIHFEVIGAGEVIWLTQGEYTHGREIYSVDVPGLPAGTPENRIIIKEAYMVTPDNVAEVATRILEYYQQKYTLDTKLFASEVAIGDSTQIDTQNSKEFGGICERMEIDLEGGFVQQIKSRGAILPYNQTWYGVEHIVLGGGGAGANDSKAGGGGAGQFIHGIDLLTVGTTYPIIVGDGGAGSVGGAGTNGGDSTYNSHTALGGGHGGKNGQDGADGGCGGGAGGAPLGSPNGSAGAGALFAGGEGSNGPTNYGGGGGGGCSERGSGGYSGAATPGAGGDGKSSDITGSSITYGGGGGGIGVEDSGSGGDGGGGNGNKNGAGQNGTDALGAGGGASDGGNAGGDGGKGLLVLRMLTTKYTGTTTGAPTVTTDGDYTVLKYENDGSYTA